jgi:DNA-directed RNA polymerase subunit N (RpoN/RPB10)
MKKRVKKYEEISPVEFLLLREKLGIKRYRKTVKRDEEKTKILLELGLKKIEEKEKDDFIPLGYRRRKVKIS